MKYVETFEWHNKLWGSLPDHLLKRCQFVTLQELHVIEMVSRNFDTGQEACETCKWKFRCWTV